jgi:hypothetical protein
LREVTEFLVQVDRIAGPRFAWSGQRSALVSGWQAEHASTQLDQPPDVLGDLAEVDVGAGIVQQRWIS